MKKPLLWSLLIPLLLASALTLTLAYMLSGTLDYASIFLNLSTDFVMVVITILYIDRVLKRHEDEQYKGIDFLINYRLYNLANSIIETLCLPLGIDDRSLPVYQEFTVKLRSQKKGNGTETDYYGDFAKKFIAGYFVTDTKAYALSKDWSTDRLRHAKLDAQACKRIYEKLVKYDDEIKQLIDFYSIRITANQLEALMNTQFWLQNSTANFDGLLARNGWGLWYRTSLECLSQGIGLLEASNLYWKIIPAG
jgi:hypothetical protein